jgi:hypothetical protein
MKILPILAATFALMSSVALTQEPNRSPPAADRSIPGKDILPQEQGLPVPPAAEEKSRKEPLTEKVNPDVVSPPPDVDPGLRIPAPVLDPLATIVVPPARSPENQPTDRPK